MCHRYVVYEIMFLLYYRTCVYVYLFIWDYKLSKELWRC